MKALEQILEQLINDKEYHIKTKADHSYDYNGVAIPSVTTILSRCIHEDYLMQWANYLGFKRKKYSDVLNTAATIGTMGHDSVEDFLKTGTNNGNVCLKGFLLWWEPLIEDHNVEILGIEQRLVLPYCGGTYDLLLKIDGRIFLIDLKTSNNLSFKYFLQLAAYRHMLYRCNNINIDGCVVLQLDKEYPGFNEQLLDFSNIDDYNFIEQCAYTFMALALSFYNIEETQYLYKNKFK